MVAITTAQHMRAANVNFTFDSFVASDTTTTLGTGAAETLILWPQLQTFSGNVFASDTGNGTFTLLKTGIWIVEACMRTAFVTPPTTGDHFFWLYNQKTAIQYAGQTIQAPIAKGSIFDIFTVHQFPAGTILETRLRNTTNQTVTLSQVPDLCHLSFTWLQPY